jgi:hypothetical protein
MTPRQMFNWAEINIQNMNFEFGTELEFTEEKLLFKRNSAARPIHGTLTLHVFLPIQRGKLIVKKLSTSAEFEECCVLQKNMILDDEKGFVTSVWQCLVVRMH